MAVAPTRGAVVITGASTGIGQASALHLASLGFKVFAGVRREEDAERLRAAAANGNIEPVQIDVTDQASIDAA
ncbi:MAG: SDR family NAD(P)-dependent oxidoreductase, partial [Gaiellaceae bacterium]